MAQMSQMTHLGFSVKAWDVQAEQGIRHTNFELYKGLFSRDRDTKLWKSSKKSTKIGEDGDEKHFIFIHLFIRLYLGLQNFPPS